MKNNLLKLYDKKSNIITLLHNFFLSYKTSKKKNTASTKTKAEVEGGGKKPWKQKGTGKARAGSTRSPLWVGGGTIFGPHPYRNNLKINVKFSQLTFSYIFIILNKDLYFFYNYYKFNSFKLNFYILKKLKWSNKKIKIFSSNKFFSQCSNKIIISEMLYFILMSILKI